MNYDLTLNEVCIITTVSGKKDKTRKYSLSSSTALLVVCRHANDWGKSTILHSSPGVDLLYGRTPGGTFAGGHSTMTHRHRFIQLLVFVGDFT